MTVKQIPTDEMLDKLHDMYMEGLPTPQKVEAAIKHIRSHAGKELYNEIEDDLSIIMDHYEVRGLQLGFSIGLKMVISFSQEHLNA